MPADRNPRTSVIPREVRATSLRNSTRTALALPGRVAMLIRDASLWRGLLGRVVVATRSSCPAEVLGLNPEASVHNSVFFHSLPESDLFPVSVILDFNLHFSSLIMASEARTSHLQVYNSDISSKSSQIIMFQLTVLQSSGTANCNKKCVNCTQSIAEIL